MMLGDRDEHAAKSVDTENNKMSNVQWNPKSEFDGNYKTSRMTYDTKDIGV